MFRQYSKRSGQGEPMIPPLIIMRKDRERNERDEEEEKGPDVSRVLGLEESLVESELLYEQVRREADPEDNEFLDMHKMPSDEMGQKEEQSESSRGIVQIFQQVLCSASKPLVPPSHHTQFLFSILTNRNKLQHYLHYLTQLQIKHKQHATSNSSIIEHLNILICLLLKIIESRAEVGVQTSEQVPSLTFTTNHNEAEFSKQNEELRKLRNMILEKEQYLYEVKTKYDEVVNNYASSIANIDDKTSERGSQSHINDSVDIHSVENKYMEKKNSRPMTFIQNVKTESREGFS